MPKITSQRTFTACWTCRSRNRRCDLAVPQCTPCTQSRIQCEGYQIRLVWVDPATGGYTPQQRRAYPCHLTWQGYPAWTLKEVAHLIEDGEGRQCRCRLHRVPNPFQTFPQLEETVLCADDGADTASTNLSIPSPTAKESPWSSNDTMLTYDPFDSSPILPIETPYTATCVFDPKSGQEDGSPCRGLVEDASDSLSTQVRSIRNAGCNSMATFTLTVPLFGQVLSESGNSEANRLFHHYFTFVSRGMVPVDDICNPWKSTYPSIAIEYMSYSSSRSLYHAMLAQSAYNLANLKGDVQGIGEKASAMHHYGAALRELRKSLATPAENYSGVLGALLTIVLAEYVFQGEVDGWQDHFQAAMAFVSQHRSRRPWKQSRRAWNITQSFALTIIVSRTVEGCSTSWIGSENQVNDFLCEMMAEPGFGYTMGGAAHIFKALHQARLLEEHLIATGFVPRIADMDEATLGQLEEITRQLHMPVEGQVDTYLQFRKNCGVDDWRPLRKLVSLHLHLFNQAVMIYLLATVLRYPPCAVVERVDDVLRAASDYIDLRADLPGSFSIWPIFIAAMAAYTPEAQALATYCLNVAETTGTRNRRELHRVVRQVWADREQLAREHLCDPGAVFVNWRDVMTRLDAHILLL